ncbi:hypothetical protein D3C76_636460 [compost metagenome]
MKLIGRGTFSRLPVIASLRIFAGLSLHAPYPARRLIKDARVASNAFSSSYASKNFVPLGSLLLGSTASKLAWQFPIVELMKIKRCALTLP